VAAGIVGGTTLSQEAGEKGYFLGGQLGGTRGGNMQHAWQIYSIRHGFLGTLQKNQSLDVC
jgi:hypothetical protein